MILNTLRKKYGSHNENSTTIRQYLLQFYNWYNFISYNEFYLEFRVKNEHRISYGNRCFNRPIYSANSYDEDPRKNTHTHTHTTRWNYKNRIMNWILVKTIANFDYFNAHNFAFYPIQTPVVRIKSHTIQLSRFDIFWNQLIRNFPKNVSLIFPLSFYSSEIE